MPTNRFTTSGPSYSFGRPWTPGVKILILTNAAVFLLQMAFNRTDFFPLLTLQVPEVIGQLRLWQCFTYMFLHNNFWHLAFNMLALWFFGSDVEETLGTRLFYFYYLLCGVGAGLGVTGVGVWAHEHSQTLGASGAIFGILLAYGLLFAERVITLLIFLILPVQMKAKTMVLLFGAIEFLAGVGDAFGRVSHLAHLSGMVVGFVFFLFARPTVIPSFNIFQRVRLWRAGRNVRKMDPEEEVDAILEKISKKGIQSLNRHEREILSEAARRRNHWPGAN